MTLGNFELKLFLDQRYIVCPLCRLPGSYSVLRTVQSYELEP